MRAVHGRLKYVALCGGALACAPAFAHSFGRSYNLPVPVWFYLYGAAAALALSFVLVGYFVGSTPARRGGWHRDLSDSPLVDALYRLRTGAIGRALALLLLLLCIATGLFGTRNPYGNFNMTLFWVVFLLGFTYLTALAGDLYAVLNPFRTSAALVGRMLRGYPRGRFDYPERLGYWPAVVFYMLFIALELFGAATPRALSLLLATWLAITLLGVGLIGAAAWFRYCDFLAVFLRLVATMAPVDVGERGANGRRRIRLRLPFSGLLETRTEHFSLLVFILFMLSSTAYDGLHETVFWKRLFWTDLSRLLQPLLDPSPFRALAELRPWFHAWQIAWLALSPFVYLAVYLLFVRLVKWAAASALTVKDLALRFAPSLLPIALVYHVTHYYTLLQVQGIRIVPLASDPFGFNWDLFGTAGWFRAPIVPDAGTVWHVQVALIVLGHLVGVYVAHLEALRIFADRRRAVLSQLPMLALMVMFTTAGLWILSLPLGAT